MTSAPHFPDVDENNSSDGANDDLDAARTDGKHCQINLKIKDNHFKDVPENYSKVADNYNNEYSEGNRSCSISSRSVSGSDIDENSVTPPPNRKRRASPKTSPDPSFGPPPQAMWNLHQHYERFYESNHSDCKNDNQRRHSSSDLREEKRPTPTSTPNSKNSENGDNLQSLDGAAVLQKALSGGDFQEKERRLSEMILQLQMVRDQLVSQQEQQNKVGDRYSSDVLSQ
ncbi:UNVERIFIED_CONTAM: hypothetical protein PYX00_005680 [Menopon gallinae]|uniref:Uncharacterized protein n=1 Tax=Menopon gallinae TaxID=328185 RepID=A0AAW2HSH5_9NEOP